MHNELDLLKKAYDKETVQVKFSIPIDGNKTIGAVISIDDRTAISKQLRKLYQLSLADYKAEGYHNRPVNQDDWQRYLDSIKDEKVREVEKKRPPKNLAEQLANIDAREELIVTVAPQFIRRETGELMFETADARKQFAMLAKRNMKLANIVAENFLKLFDQMREAEDTAKNS